MFLAALTLHTIVSGGVTRQYWEHNAARVIVGGMSNGAIMALRFGCESDKAQTIVSVAGALSANEVARCTHHASNVLLVNGTEDPLVKYTGSAILLGAYKTFETLANQRTCATPALVKSFAKGTDGTSADITRAHGCANNARVALIAVAGGGHGWPGGSPYFSKAIVGVTSNAFDLSGYIMQFAFGETSL